MPFKSIPLYFAAVLPVVLLAAFISWELIEKPALSLKKHVRRSVGAINADAAPKDFQTPSL